MRGESIINKLLILIAFIPAMAWSASKAPDPELAAILKAAVQDTRSFGDRFEAEVWFTDMAYRLRHKISRDEERVQFLKLVHEEARRADLPPELVLAVIEVESNFNRWAISHAGARGLMQIMPFWLDEIGRPQDNLFHARTNLRFGCTILRHYLDKENGNLIRALGRYNGSLGSYRYPNLVLTALRERWYRP
jgi:soluble lytic murein transglycosylase-like protein